jgi:hypothetical protein
MIIHIAVLPKPADLRVSLQFYQHRPSEPKTPLQKRSPEHTISWKVHFGDPYDTFRAQLLVQIDKYFEPQQINFEDYLIRYTILRLSPNPITLDEDGYEALKESIGTKKPPSVTVYVQPTKPVQSTTKSNKENAADGEDGSGDEARDQSKKKGKKNQKSKVCCLRICKHIIHHFQVPKAADISPENIAKNDNIKMLNGKWGCESPDGSTHCWVSPTDSSHVHLTHAHFEAWAEAVVCFNSCYFMNST